MKSLTIDRLKELVSYDPITGLFSRLKDFNNNARVDSKVGHQRCDNYIQIRIDSSFYLAHRLAWFYMNGKWPDKLIDHINGNRSDNRLCNLREATLEQNKHNELLRKTNSSGAKGVSWDKRRQKWNAKVWSNNKCYNLGCFADIELAELVASSAREKLHGEFANHGGKAA